MVGTGDKKKLNPLLTNNSGVLEITQMAYRTIRARAIAAGIRMEFLRRGLKSADVGLRLGVSGDHVSNVVSGSSRSRTLRVQIEDFLGTAFWSSREDFLARQRLAGSTGETRTEQTQEGRAIEKTS